MTISDQAKKLRGLNSQQPGGITCYTSSVLQGALVHCLRFPCDCVGRRASSYFRCVEEIERKLWSTKFTLRAWWQYDRNVILEVDRRIGTSTATRGPGFEASSESSTRASISSFEKHEVPKRI